jgi:tight adherence protein C
VADGFEGMVEPHEVIALRVLVPLGFGGVICALIALTIPLMSGKVGIIMADRQFTFYFIFILLFGIYTDLWLKSAVKARHHKIERALPFVLDLLTLAVESGLDFMSGINRIIQKREIDPLGEELIRVFREIQVGRSRKEALRNFAVRVDHPDIRAVSNALIQADELGSGIGGAMRIQSDQIRIKRFQKAEKKGNEAPVKMLFPLIAFIFPSVFLILLGPIILRLLAGVG